MAMLDGGPSRIGCLNLVAKCAGARSAGRPRDVWRELETGLGITLAGHEDPPHIQASALLELLCQLWTLPSRTARLGLLTILREEGFYRGTELLIGVDQKRLDHVLG